MSPGMPGRRCIQWAAYQIELDPCGQGLGSRLSRIPSPVPLKLYCPKYVDKRAKCFDKHAECVDNHAFVLHQRWRVIILTLSRKLSQLYFYQLRKIQGTTPAPKVNPPPASSWHPWRNINSALVNLEIQSISFGLSPPWESSGKTGGADLFTIKTSNNRVSFYWEKQQIALKEKNGPYSTSPPSHPDGCE